MPRKNGKPTTRECLLDAALDLFAEDGFTGTTISEVERRVGLAVGTGSFYRHFKSKEALLQAAVEHEVARCMADSIAERAAMPTASGPREQFAISATQILRDLRRFDRLFRLTLTEGDRVPEVRNAVTAAVRGSGAVSWSADTAAVTVIAALLGFHVLDMIGGDPNMVGEEQFIEALADFGGGVLRS